MTEPATEKQIKFMKSLGVPADIIPQLSKQAAKEIIQKNLDLEKEKFPVVKPGFTPKTPQNVSNRELSMFVAYAKDLVVAGKTADEAIEIVKRLRTELC